MALEEPLALDAIRRANDRTGDKGRVALAGIIFANRQHILAVEPWGKGMLGTTLRYDYEVRDESEFFKGIGSHHVPKEMVSLASHILDSKAGHFDPAKFKDEFELALRKLVKRKAAGKTIEAPEEREEPSNVVDLMEALRQSVIGKKAAALRSGGDSKKRSRPRAQRRQRKRKAA
jgi:DNA end-binding protein Ku